MTSIILNACNGPDGLTAVHPPGLDRAHKTKLYRRKFPKSDHGARQRSSLMGQLTCGGLGKPKGMVKKRENFMKKAQKLRSSSDSETSWAPFAPHPVRSRADERFEGLGI